MLAPHSSSRLCSLAPLPRANKIDVASNKLAATPNKSGNLKLNPLPEPKPAAGEGVGTADLGSEGLGVVLMRAKVAWTKTSSTGGVSRRASSGCRLSNTCWASSERGAHPESTRSSKPGRLGWSSE
nr:hypothetical protein [uncultured bacterium]